MDETLNDYERILLKGWEYTYHKGQLTLWLLIAVQKAPKYMGEIQSFLQKTTHGTVMPDEKSLYRTLRRLTEASMISYKEIASPLGPKKKVYSLTKTGKSVLGAFIERNIRSLYVTGENRKLFS